MFANYFKTALRALTKNRLYTFINLTGLAVGLAVAMLILLFVYHEMSYDHFHDKSNRIYRMLGKVNYGGQEIQLQAMSSAFGPLLKQNEPLIENYVRTRAGGRVIIKSDEAHTFFETQFVFADSALLSVFSFHLQTGSGTSLTQPGHVFITEAMALKYFNTTEVIGKILNYNNEYEMTVAGIIQPAPSSSSIQFDFVGSFPSLGQIESEKAQYNHDRASLGAYVTYLLLQSPDEVASVQASIPAIANTSVDEKYILEPLQTIHIGNNFGDSANSRNIYMFLFVAFLILALALVNYMNLTTARAMARAKEVGIRKIIGARRLSVSAQFYTESALITIGAFLLAFVLVELFLPVMLNTLQQPLDHTFLTSPLFLSMLGGLLIACVLISGSYPAIVLSRFQPAEILKGKVSGTGQGAWVRKGFTTFQFAVSIGLILCTVVVREQLDFLRNQNLGLNKEQVMVVELTKNSAEGFAGLKNELRQLSGVQQVSASTLALYKGGHSMFFSKVPGTQDDVAINYISVDEQFADALDLTWVNKSREKPIAGNLIINESAISKLKLDKDLLGVKLELGNGNYEVTGIVKDFNYASLQHQIEGLVINVESDTTNLVASSGASLYIRLDPTVRLSDKVETIKSVFKKHAPDSPVEFYFLDDAFNNLYKSEDRLARLFEVFTALGIGIACLGLFGLVTFALERRIKEIGIRKVLGASGFHIVKLFSAEFIVLYFISLAVAVPVSWWAMEQWLIKFSYRIALSWWMVAVAAAFTIAIAWITISVKTWRASLLNPVDSLRDE